MSTTGYIGFQCDYSDKGTLTLTIQVPTNKRKPDGTIVWEDVKLLIPLWLPLRLDAKGEEEVVEDTYFVSCRSKKGSTIEFFISKADFESRVPRDNTNYQAVYRRDWDSAADPKTPDSLSCVGYDDDGLVLGTKDARAWPTRGIIAPAPRTGTDSEKEKARMDAQAAIWRDIAITSTSAGASRLWKPTSWTGPKLKVYFRARGSSPSSNELKAVADQIRTEETKKAGASARRLALTDWLEWAVPLEKDNFDWTQYVLLSTDLLGFYGTYISKGDLQALVNAQTQASADWRRTWPSEGDAQTIQNQMLANLSKTNKTYYNLLNGGVKVTSTTWISSSKTFATRIDANKIMGAQSANQLGKQWWKSGDHPKVVAEWLHRSAYSLGPLNGADFQSPDNIVFGTFEANSDMTRAETTIRTLRDVAGAEGTLTTTVVNKNVTSPDGNLTYIDPTTGQAKPWTIDAWVATKNYTWIAPNLLYQGEMKLPKTSVRLTPFVWAKQFHTFSRYSPIILEGKLDSRLLSERLNSLKLSPALSLSNASKPGSSSADIASTVRVRKLLIATPSLAAAPAPPAVPSTRPKRDVIATLPEALSAKNSGAFATHPTTHAAWQSITHNAPHVMVGDVRLENPRLADDGNDIGTPTDAPPASGFMLEGTIKLFGLDKYEASLQSWHGPPPPGVDIGLDVPIYQRVQLDSVQISELIPLLEGTQFEDFEFKNVSITYQNYQFVDTMLPGWTLTADIDIDEKSQTLYQTLHDILGISDAGLRVQVSVYLGLGHSWTTRPRVTSFVVTGVLDVTSNDVEPTKGVQLCDGVVLSRVGVSIYGISVPTLGINSTDHTQYGFKVFGDMHINVPGSVTYLDFDFVINEFGAVVQLDATVKGDLWKNAFGAGIDLGTVQLSAILPLSRITSLTCTVRAHLQAESASALVMGTFTIGQSYALSAYVENLGADGIVDLFRHYTGDELSVPSHVDVTIGSATIEVSTEKGLYIEVDNLAFDSYQASSAIVQLSSKGVLVRANMEKIELPGDVGVSLVEGYMEVSFEKQGSGKSSDVALGGKVQLTGLPSIPSIEAGVHLYKPSASKDLQWTVYGSFTALGNTTTLGELFSELKGSFLQDFALQDLMFIAASSDDPMLSDMNPQKYPIKKGVQFSALLGEVDPVNKLLRRTSFPGLILDARWASGKSFILNVVLPTDTMIHLGHGVTTDPITLSINTEQLLLQIATGVKVPVPESDTPLDFEAALTIKGEAVKLEGEMNGLWNDPFGVSKSVSIGPFLELGLAIDLLVFPETGIPTSFSFAGGLAIGETEGQVAVQISDIPSRELLKGEIKNFGIQDIVTFTREVTELPIPIPPNFIDFEDVKLYMSTGVTLGTVTYPAGFSFNASLSLFGANFHASAEVSGGALKLNGSVDEISVGPLHITGQNGVSPMVDLHVGATDQRLKVDGAMEFLGAHVGLVLDLEILPEPIFSYNFQLNFTELLVFMVNAQMIGKVNDLKDLSELNFVLHALFEQHLVEYVRQQVLAALEAVKKTTDDAIRAAEVKVQEEEERLQQGIDSAQADLMKAYNSWTAYSEKVKRDSQAFIDKYMSQLHVMQTAVDDARKKFNTKLKAAEGTLQQANADRAAKMKAAEADVTKAKAKWDSDVANAEKKLEDAKRYMQQKFGSAEKDIENAKRKVDGLQSEIDSTESRISYCAHSAWYRFDLKAELVWLGPKLAALEVAKTTADGVLWAAEEIVKGTAYLGAKAAIPAAEKVVEETGRAGDLAFKGAQATLQDVDAATAFAVDAATDVLQTVQKEGNAVILDAESTLQKFVDINKTLLTDAKNAVFDLIHSAEWLAYQTASTALDAAKHATHALDVAKSALEAAKMIVDGTIVVAEASVEAALGALDITKIELVTTFDKFVGGQSGYHFDAEVEGKVVGKPFTLELKLDMANTAQLITDIFHELLKII